MVASLKYRYENPRFYQKKRRLHKVARIAPKIAEKTRKRKHITRPHLHQKTRGTAANHSHGLGNKSQWLPHLKHNTMTGLNCNKQKWKTLHLALSAILFNRRTAPLGLCFCIQIPNRSNLSRMRQRTDVSVNNNFAINTNATNITNHSRLHGEKSEIWLVLPT